ncbi:hypothetical protein [Clostridium sp. TF11-13AC]|uniref:hypothetical protein n=1 Tax=Clostridium sp. TF11-13AC TaxID=2293053 RepID=UPI000E539E5C|nr:hypothetical protein [Clostridium sp. TF11-13AC]RHU41734.1 hypothetical protein DXD12_14260 [Clostridium sp. TF11-13AC]
MKSAYCIAITACLTVIWLYEEKKKRGMAGKLCWKAAAGYLITRFVFFAISNQEVHGFLEVMAMDLVTAGLLYILSGKNGSRESVWECLYLYIWNPIPVLSVLSQGKKRMLFIWLAVLILFVDRALQSASWNRKIQKNWNSSHGCGNWHTLGAGYHRRALRTVQSGR